MASNLSPLTRTSAVINPRQQEFTHFHSSIPNGEHYEEAEGSVEASADEEYVGDSEDDDDDEDYHEEDEEEAQASERIERRSKLWEDPEVGPTRTSASAIRPSKRDRAAMPESTEKVAKQPRAKVAKEAPKQAPRTRKALPRMKIVVPVASTAATSMTSLPRDGGDHMEEDTSNAATSQRAEDPILVEDDEEPPLSVAPRTSTAAPSQVLGTPPRARAVMSPPSSAPPTTSALVVSTSVGRSTGPLGMPAVMPTPQALVVPTSQAPVVPTPQAAAYPLYHVPEDQTGAAKEAMIQAGLMMRRTKEAYEASKLAYDASSALEANVRKACEIGTKYAELAKEKTDLSLDFDAMKDRLEKTHTELKTLGDTMKKALEEKDKDLAAAQKVAKEKSDAADKKLSAVKKLEDENAQLKKEKAQWNEKYERLKERKAKMEKLFEDYTREMYTMLDEFCADFDKETEELEPKLDPTKSLTRDACMMNTYRLEARLKSVQDYINRLKEALTGIDKELWPEDTRLLDLEPMMSRLQGIPRRVQAWKKSAARCGADVALSLVRVHCKEAREDKLKSLQVVNTKKLQFETFMETFIAAATRIADGIGLDTFIEPASP